MSTARHRIELLDTACNCKVRFVTAFLRVVRRGWGEDAASPRGEEFALNIRNLKKKINSPPGRHVEGARNSKVRVQGTCPRYVSKVRVQGRAASLRWRCICRRRASSFIGGVILRARFDVDGGILLDCWVYHGDHLADALCGTTKNTLQEEPAEGQLPQIRKRFRQDEQA
jgi:hypothetical protein